MFGFSYISKMVYQTMQVKTAKMYVSMISNSISCECSLNIGYQHTLNIQLYCKYKERIMLSMLSFPSRSYSDFNLFD